MSSRGGGGKGNKVNKYSNIFNGSIDLINDFIIFLYVCVCELHHRVKGALLVAPAIEGDIPIAPVIWVLRTLAHYYPKWTPFFMPNPVSLNRIVQDINVQKYMLKILNEKKLTNIGNTFQLGTAVTILFFVFVFVISLDGNDLGTGWSVCII